jgi:hypothetical protein
MKGKIQSFYLFGKAQRQLLVEYYEKNSLSLRCF